MEVLSKGLRFMYNKEGIYRFNCLPKVINNFDGSFSCLSYGDIPSFVYIAINSSRVELRFGYYFGMGEVSKLRIVNGMEVGIGEYSGRLMFLVGDKDLVWGAMLGLVIGADRVGSRENYKLIGDWLFDETA
jgi:hypothetical protein